MTPLSLLLVDDDTVGTALRSLVYQQCGYLVFTAPSGTEALRMIESMTFNLIVLDIEMPGMSGLELARTLNLRGSVTPILFLSGALDVAWQGLGAGFVSKGSHASLLLATTARLASTQVPFPKALDT